MNTQVTYLVHVKHTVDNESISLVRCAPDLIVEKVFTMAGSPDTWTQWQALGCGEPAIKCTPRLHLFTEDQANAYQLGYVGDPVQQGTWLQRTLSKLGFIDSEADAANGEEQ